MNHHAKPNFVLEEIYKGTGMLGASLASNDRWRILQRITERLQEPSLQDMIVIDRQRALFQVILGELSPFMKLIKEKCPQAQSGTIFDQKELAPHTEDHSI